MAPQANAALLQLLVALDMELKFTATNGLYQVVDCQTHETMGRSQDSNVAAIIAMYKLRRSFDALCALRAAMHNHKE